MSAARAPSPASAADGRRGGGGEPAKVPGDRDLSSHLANSSVPMAALHGVCAKHMGSLLAKFRGPKALVLDPELQRFVDLISSLPRMRAAGVQDFPDWSSRGVIPSDAARVVFLLRPDPSKLRHIAARIRLEQQQLRNPRTEYVVACVPKFTKLCRRTLEDAGVLGDVTTADLPIELVPMEDDLLSMELSSSFADLFLSDDSTALVHVARALIKLQAMFGSFATISGHGKAAVRAAELLQRLQREADMDGPAGSGNAPGVGIDELILLDRGSDFVTPLLTQYTYEGLVDEVFGIQKGFIKVDPAILENGGGGAGVGGSGGPSSAVPGFPPQPDKVVLLNGQDVLFKEIRDFNFAVLGPFLHRKAESVKVTYEERHGAQSVHDLHAFLPKFKNANTEHTLLALHVNLARAIAQITKTTKFDRRQEAEADALRLRNAKECDEFVEQMVWKMENKVEMYRYLCLISHTVGVKNQKRFDALKHEIISSYGFAELLTLEHLEKVGLFRKPSKKKYWSIARKHFNLIVEEPKLQDPTDPSYAFNGYAPLSARIVEMASAPGGWHRVAEGLDGPTFTKRQGDKRSGLVGDPAQAGLPGAGGPAAAAVIGGSGGRRKPVSLVFFVGGVTYAEISAIRQLSESTGRDYIVATTQLLNGRSMIAGVLQEFNGELLLGDRPGMGGGGGNMGRRR